MKGRRGFTLLEVAVALAILASGVVTCLQIFASSLRLETRSAMYSRAVLHARAAMDALLFQPEVVDHEETRPPTADGFTTHILVRHAGKDEGVETKDLDFVSDATLRYLQVDVTWQEGSGSKTYTVRSMRSAVEIE